MLTTKEWNEANQIIVDGIILKDRDNPIPDPRNDLAPDYNFEEWEEDEMDLLQVHDHMVSNYIPKIAKKWAIIQGIDINKYNDLCEEGKEEVREFYREHPTDLANIRRIILKGVRVGRRD